MLRPAMLAAAIAAAFPVHANSDLDALRAELRQMKSSYEARIQALEARIQQAEATPRPAPAAAPAPAPTANRFNPEISLILQGRYAYLGGDDDRHVAGFLPAGDAHGPESGFAVDHTELVMSASIDPYFLGYFNVALEDEKVSVEEAWVQTTSLGHGVSAKAGRFRSGLGYQNEKHPHAWDFADNSLMYRVLFGEGYSHDGVQFKWVAPTALFTELGVEAGRGGAFPGAKRNSNGIGSSTLFGRIGGDVGASHSWRAGLSYVDAKPHRRKSEIEDANDVEATTRFSGTSRTALADFVWKWAPDGNARERNFKLAAEYFRRNERGNLLCEDNTSSSGACNGTTGAYHSRQSGFYAEGVYQFMPRWRTGYRYDQLNRGSVDFGANAAALSLADAKPQRHSLMLDYSPSEFSRLRLQYSNDRTTGGPSEDQWFLQYVHSLGAHGAHKF